MIKDDYEQIFIGGVSSYLKNEADIDKVMNYFNENPDINFKIVLTHEGDYINTTVSYTHLRAHETDSYLVCRLLLEKKKKKKNN